MNSSLDAELAGFAKYVSASTAKIVLENRTLRWSKPHTFNDPFDSLARFDLYPPIDPLKGMIMDEFRRAIKYGYPRYAPASPGSLIIPMREDWVRGRYSMASLESKFWEGVKAMTSTGRLTEQYFNESVVGSFDFEKILCLTKNINNMEMWMYYADSNRGAVLVFHPTTSESVLHRAKPVIYTDARRSIFNDGNLPMYLTGKIDPFHPEFLKWIHELMFLTKRLRLAHEEEWRIYSDYNQDDASDFEDKPFPAEELKAIIFGYSSDASLRMTAAES